MKFLQYEHHGKLVWTRDDLKGKHWNNCLCATCAKLHPGTPENCPIAQGLYEYDVKHNLTTPVFECPEFQE